MEARASQESFQFEMPSTAEAFVSLDFYNDRQYPYDCSGETTATLSLLKDGRKIDSTRV